MHLWRTPSYMKTADFLFNLKSFATIGELSPGGYLILEICEDGTVVGRYIGISSSVWTRSFRHQQSLGAVLARLDGRENFGKVQHIRAELAARGAKEVMSLPLWYHDRNKTGYDVVLESATMLLEQTLEMSTVCERS